MRPTPFALVLLLTACGGASSAPKSPAPEAATEKPASAEEQCLAEAAAPRTPRADAPEHITVSHILVRHSGVKHAGDTTRSRGEACLRAEKAREELLAGAEWETVVEKYSDAGATTGGSLGSVGMSDLDPTFAKAAFSLDVNELSHVVETDRGFHVIVRTE